jgi:nucleoside-diphosphate-sugar epimerase
MRILITGGAGFIGSHLAEALLADGQNVFVIDNYSTGRRENLKPQERLTVQEGTIADTGQSTGSSMTSSRRSWSTPRHPTRIPKPGSKTP